jgi:hypothetical protein
MGVERAIGRRREIAADALDLGDGQIEVAVADLLPLLFDQLGEAIDADAVDQDLDARLVEIVAPSELVVDAEDRLQVGEQVPLRQERPDRLGDHGRAALAAADQHLEADLAGLVPVHAQADIVHLHGGAVVRRTRDRDLELAREERELRMEGRPLPDDFAVDAGIFDLIAGHAGKVIGGDVADAVAGGLDGVHLHARQLGQDVGRVLQPDPVELQVLPRGEVAVALVVAARDVGQLAQLPGRERAVGHGDAQHVGMQLQIESVHQAQRLELVFAELAGDAAVHLIAELLDAFVDQRLIIVVVAIHGSLPVRRGRGRRGRAAELGVAAGAERAQDLAVARRHDAFAVGADADQIGRHDDAVGRRLLGDGQQRRGRLVGLADAGQADLLDPLVAVGQEDDAPIAESIRGDHLEGHCQFLRPSRSPGARNPFPSMSSPGLTRRSMRAREGSGGRAMAARVKPGHDSENENLRLSAFICGSNLYTAIARAGSDSSVGVAASASAATLPMTISAGPLMSLWRTSQFSPDSRP